MKKVRKLDSVFIVEYINGEAVVAMHTGKLLILDDNLETKREFDAEPNARLASCQSISGNEKFIAVGYFDGTVRYWSKSSGTEPVVRLKFLAS